MSPHRQLPLPFLRAQRRPLAAFLRAPSNEAALTWLDRVDEWPQRRLALWGEAGCGKSHLLETWTAATGAQLLHGAELPELNELPDLPSASGLAIDDADLMAREATLLHLLNAAAEARLPVLLAARTPPARWPVRLPDLASRLRAITAVEIEAPEDSLLRALLARLLADRGQRVPSAIQEFLLSHLPRTPAILRDAVDRLDRAAVARPGGITQPFARDVLADLLNEPAAELEAGVAADLHENSVSSEPRSPPMGPLL